MHIEFDPAQNDLNVQRRGLSFESAAEFAFDTALVYVDQRRDYGETRYVALGLLGSRPHVLCFTEVPGGIRVISFRKSNPREINRYAKVQTAD